MASIIPVTRLSGATMHHLRPEVQIPAYDRSVLRQGIVHIGVGGFHRAHQAVYLDDLLHRPGSEAFGLCGVGLLPHDQHMGEVLRAQDYLYTMITRGAEGDHARVIGSIVNFLHAPADPEAVIKRMASADTKIVSLTITDAGYCQDKVRGELDDAHPSIVHDLRHPDRPRGVYGFLAEALQRRKLARVPPFTVMSCDNLLKNGDLCRRMTLAFLAKRDPALASWVADNGAFPNSMVDRITPATTDTHRTLARESFGIDDAWPVTSEPFRQWVIEDHFSQGRPAWETVGAQMVGNVEPYEKMKLRLLNGGHQVMCFIGMLLGHRFAPQAMADVQVETLIRKFMDHEVTSLLDPVPGIDLEDYKKTLLERFANPAINDQLGRIGTDGSARIAEFVLPTIVEQLRRNGPIQAGAFTVAAWIRYLTVPDDQRNELPFADTMGESLRQRAREGGANPSAVLSIRELFSDDLTGSRRFVDEVQHCLENFYQWGARGALTRCIASGGTIGTPPSDTDFTLPG